MPYLILCFRNRMCGKCTRSAAGSSFQRVTAFESSMRTSSTDLFLEQLSLPFLTINNALYIPPLSSTKSHSKCLVFVVFVFGVLLSHAFFSGNVRKLKIPIFPFIFRMYLSFTAWGMNVRYVRDRHHLFFL